MNGRRINLHRIYAHATCTSSMGKKRKYAPIQYALLLLLNDKARTSLNLDFHRPFFYGPFMDAFISSL